MRFTNSWSISAPHEVGYCATGALLSEVVAWPKPGNVHRTRDFPTTRFEHFIMGDLVLVDVFTGLARDASRGVPVHLGARVTEATTRMMAWQTGGNVNLGQILLLVPLVAATGTVLSLDAPSIPAVRDAVATTLQASTVEDALAILAAVRDVTPGGMAPGAEFDVWDPATRTRVERERVTPQRLFAPTAEFDWISHEWVHDYALTFETTYPILEKNLATFPTFNACLVATFLEILAALPDSLIHRKAGPAAAREVSDQAREIRAELPVGALHEHPEAVDRLLAFDATLQRHEGKRNPGTTADLLAAALFLAFAAGLRP